jgi:hypothetical protein
MNDPKFLKELIASGNSSDDGYFQYAHVVATLLPKNLIEPLRQLVNGPVYDGDVISKSLRNDLLALGLAVRVCHKGQQGYTGATYFAFSVLNCIDKIKKGEIAA